MPPDGALLRNGTCISHQNCIQKSGTLPATRGATASTGLYTLLLAQPGLDGTISDARSIDGMYISSSGLEKTWEAERRL